MQSNWTLFLVPTLLRGRFVGKKYYDHFISLVSLLNHCLQLEISLEEVDELEEGFIKWVIDYERSVQVTLP